MEKKWFALIIPILVVVLLAFLFSNYTGKTVYQEFTASAEKFGSRIRIGQTFSLPENKDITTACLFFGRIAKEENVEDVTWEIYTFDKLDKKPFTLIASKKTAPETDIARQERCVRFQQKVSLSANTQYVLIISSHDSDINAYRIQGSSANSYKSGEAIKSENSGNSWLPISSFDLYFALK